MLFQIITSRSNWSRRNSGRQMIRKHQENKTLGLSAWNNIRKSPQKCKIPFVSLFRKERVASANHRGCKFYFILFIELSRQCLKSSKVICSHLPLPALPCSAKDSICISALKCSPRNMGVSGLCKREVGSPRVSGVQLPRPLSGIPLPKQMHPPPRSHGLSLPPRATTCTSSHLDLLGPQYQLGNDGGYVAWEVYPVDHVLQKWL